MNQKSSPPEKSWIWLAILAGHVGAAVCAVFSVLALVAFVSTVTDMPKDSLAAGWTLAFGILAALYLAFAVIAEIVAVGLHRRRKWAWFAALPLFALWSLSVIFPIGAIGLCGLLTEGSRREFGLG